MQVLIYICLSNTLGFVIASKFGLVYKNWDLTKLLQRLRRGLFRFSILGIKNNKPSCCLFQLLVHETREKTSRCWAWWDCAGGISTIDAISSTILALSFGLGMALSSKGFEGRTNGSFNILSEKERDTMFVAQSCSKAPVCIFNTRKSQKRMSSPQCRIFMNLWMHEDWFL